MAFLTLIHLGPLCSFHPGPEAVLIRLQGGVGKQAYWEAESYQTQRSTTSIGECQRRNRRRILGLTAHWRYVTEARRRMLASTDAKRRGQRTVGLMWFREGDIRRVLSIGKGTLQGTEVAIGRQPLESEIIALNGITLDMLARGSGTSRDARNPRKSKQDCTG
ncbi:hypothetical protein BDV10DRAFT_79123 [Aspergillus recurvatus]